MEVQEVVEEALVDENDLIENVKNTSREKRNFFKNCSKYR